MQTPPPAPMKTVVPTPKVVFKLRGGNYRETERVCWAALSHVALADYTRIVSKQVLHVMEVDIVIERDEQSVRWAMEQILGRSNFIVWDRRHYETDLVFMCCMKE